MHREGPYSQWDNRSNNFGHTGRQQGQWDQRQHSHHSANFYSQRQDGRNRQQNHTSTNHSAYQSADQYYNQASDRERRTSGDAYRREGFNARGDERPFQRYSSPDSGYSNNERSSQNYSSGGQYRRNEGRAYGYEERPPQRSPDRRYGYSERPSQSYSSESVYTRDEYRARGNDVRQRGRPRGRPSGRYHSPDLGHGYENVSPQSFSSPDISRLSSTERDPSRNRSCQSDRYSSSEREQTHSSSRISGTEREQTHLSSRFSSTEREQSPSSSRFSGIEREQTHSSRFCGTEREQTHSSRFSGSEREQTHSTSRFSSTEKEQTHSSSRFRSSERGHTHLSRDRNRFEPKDRTMFEPYNRPQRAQQTRSDRDSLRQDTKGDSSSHDTEKCKTSHKEKKQIKYVQKDTLRDANQQKETDRSESDRTVNVTSSLTNTNAQMKDVLKHIQTLNDIIKEKAQAQYSALNEGNQKRSSSKENSPSVRISYQMIDKTDVETKTQDHKNDKPHTKVNEAAGNSVQSSSRTSVSSKSGDHVEISRILSVDTDQRLNRTDNFDHRQKTGKEQGHSAKPAKDSRGKEQKNDPNEYLAEDYLEQTYEQSKDFQKYTQSNSKAVEEEARKNVQSISNISVPNKTRHSIENSRTSSVDAVSALDMSEDLLQHQKTTLEQGMSNRGINTGSKNQQKESGHNVDKRENKEVQEKRSDRSAFSIFEHNESRSKTQVNDSTSKHEHATSEKGKGENKHERNEKVQTQTEHKLKDKKPENYIGKKHDKGDSAGQSKEFKQDKSERDHKKDNAKYQQIDKEKDSENVVVGHKKKATRIRSGTNDERSRCKTLNEKNNKHEQNKGEKEKACLEHTDKKKALEKSTEQKHDKGDKKEKSKELEQEKMKRESKTDDVKYHKKDKEKDISDLKRHKKQDLGIRSSSIETERPRSKTSKDEKTNKREQSKSEREQFCSDNRHKKEKPEKSAEQKQGKKAEKSKELAQDKIKKESITDPVKYQQIDKENVINDVGKGNKKEASGIRSDTHKHESSRSKTSKVENPNKQKGKQEQSRSEHRHKKVEKSEPYTEHKHSTEHKHEKKERRKSTENKHKKTERAEMSIERTHKKEKIVEKQTEKFKREEKNTELKHIKDECVENVAEKRHYKVEKEKRYKESDKHTYHRKHSDDQAKQDKKAYRDKEPKVKSKEHQSYGYKHKYEKSDKSKSSSERQRIETDTQISAKKRATSKEHEKHEKSTHHKNPASKEIATKQKDTCDDIDRFLLEIDTVLLENKKPESSTVVSVESLSTCSDSDGSSEDMQSPVTSNLRGIKDLRESDGKLLWKSVEMKTPKVVVNRLSSKSIKRIRSNLKKSKCTKDNQKATKFRRIRKKSSESSDGSESSEIYRQVSVPRSKTPIIESETEESFNIGKECEAREQADISGSVIENIELENENRKSEQDDTVDHLNGENVPPDHVKRTLSVDSNCTTRSEQDDAVDCLNSEHVPTDPLKRTSSVDSNCTTKSEQDGTVDHLNCEHVPPDHVKRTSSVDSNCTTRSEQDDTVDCLNSKHALKRKSSVDSNCTTNSEQDGTVDHLNCKHVPPDHVKRTSSVDSNCTTRSEQDDIVGHLIDKHVPDHVKRTSSVDSNCTTRSEASISTGAEVEENNTSCATGLTPKTRLDMQTYTKPGFKKDIGMKTTIAANEQSKTDTQESSLLFHAGSPAEIDSNHGDSALSNNASTAIDKTSVSDEGQVHDEDKFKQNTNHRLHKNHTSLKRFRRRQSLQTNVSKRRKIRTMSFPEEPEESGVEADIEDNDITIIELNLGGGDYDESCSKNNNTSVEQSQSIEITSENHNQLKFTDDSNRAPDLSLQSDVQKEGEREPSNRSEILYVSMGEEQKNKSEKVEIPKRTVNSEEKEDPVKAKSIEGRVKSEKNEIPAGAKVDDSFKVPQTASSNEKSKASQINASVVKTDEDKNKAQVSNEDLQPKVKQEPDWLLKGYTQEPDVIILSDDDDIVMSFSQPVINLESDSDGDIKHLSGQVKVKQETSDLSDVESVNSDLMFLDLDYAFSSVDEGSSCGSDFEPEAMFQNESVVFESGQTSYQHKSEQSKQAQSSKTQNEQEMSTQEESEEDDSDIHKTKIPVNVGSKSDPVFSSSGDEIMFTTAFELPEPKTTYSVKIEPSQKLKYETGEIDPYDVETQLSFELPKAKITPVKTELLRKQQLKTGKTDPYNAVTQLPSAGKYEEATLIDTSKAKVKQQPITKDLYAQETQVDDLSDNHSDIDALDFQSEHFTGTNYHEEPYQRETHAPATPTVLHADNANNQMYQMETQVMPRDGSLVGDDNAESADSEETNMTDSYEDPQLDLYKNIGQIKQSVAERLGIVIDYCFEEELSFGAVDDPLQTKRKANSSEGNEGQLGDSDSESSLYAAPTQLGGLPYEAETLVLTSGADEERYEDSDVDDSFYTAQTQLVKTTHEPECVEEKIGSDSDISILTVQTQHVKSPYASETQVTVPGVGVEEPNESDNDLYGAETQRFPVVNQVSDDSDDALYEAETQRYPVADQVTDDSDDALYGAQTQRFPDAGQVTNDSDDALYGAETQRFPDAGQVTNDSDDALYGVQTQKFPDAGQVTNDSDDALYGAETQRFPSGGMISDQEETLEFDDNRYDALTQVDNHEHDDICDDPYVAATQFQPHSIDDRSATNERDATKRKDLIKNNLKRPRLNKEAVGTEKDTCPVPNKKPRTAIEIQPQRQKSVAEKRTAGLLIKPGNENQPDHTDRVPETVQPDDAPRFPPPRSDIFVQNASRHDMWLSKDVAKAKEQTKPQQRKRRRTKSKEDPGTALTAQMKEAKSRLKERNFQSIVNPRAIADPAKRPKPSATVTTVDLEDAELPSCSQIVSHGFPVLNETGVLLKKPAAKAPHTGRFASRSAALTEAMLCPQGRPVKTSSVSMVTSTTTMSTPSVSPSTSYSSSFLRPSTTSTTVTVESTKTHEQSSSKQTVSADSALLKDKHSGKSSSSRDKQPHSSKSSADKHASASKTSHHKQSSHSGSSKGKHTSGSGSSKDKDSDHNKSSKDKNPSDRIKHRSGSSSERSHRPSSDKQTSSTSTSFGKHTSSVSASSDKQTSSASASSDKQTSSASNSPKESQQKDSSHKDKSSNSGSSSKGIQWGSSSSSKYKSALKTSSSKSDKTSSSASNSPKETFQKDLSGRDKVLDSASSSRDKQSSSSKDRPPLISSSTKESKKVTFANDNVVDKNSLQRQASSLRSNAANASESSKYPTSVSATPEVTTPVITRESSRPAPSNTPASYQRSSTRTSPLFEEKKSPSGTSPDQTHPKVPGSRPNLMLKPGYQTTAPVPKTPSPVYRGYKASPVYTDRSSAAPGPSPVYGDRSLAAPGPSPVYHPSFATRQPPMHPLSRDLRPAPGRSPSYGPPVNRDQQQQQQQQKQQAAEVAPCMAWSRFLSVIIKWSPKWLQEKVRLGGAGKADPPLTIDLQGQEQTTLFPLVERYQTFSEYSHSFMLPLLLHETWESCFKDWKEKKERLSLKLICNQHRNAGDRTMELKLLGLISKADRKAGLCFREGDLVHVHLTGIVRPRNNKTTGPTENSEDVMGYVDRIQTDHHVETLCRSRQEFREMRKPDSQVVDMTLKIRLREFVPSHEHLIELKEISSIVTTKRQFQALSALKSSPLCMDILRPDINSPTYFDGAPPTIQLLRGENNQSQSEAINTAQKISCLPKEASRICLLQGPPGTGKSHTIIGIIEGIYKAKAKKCCICLCAPSNAAVDELLRRLHRLRKDKSRSSINFVRLGKKTGAHPEIQPYSLDATAERNVSKAKQKEELAKKLPASLQEELRSLDNKIDVQRKKLETVTDQFQIQRLKNDIKKFVKNREDVQSKFKGDRRGNIPIDPREVEAEKKNVLVNANVIAGTLSSFGTPIIKYFYSKRMFDCVIIDEATQAIELDTLIPLQYGANKLILVGDQEQLAPTVLSQAAKEKKLELSLFERLHNHFAFNKDLGLSPVILLNTQYRMNPEIASFPSSYIYEGKLLNDDSVLRKTSCALEPYVLFDIQEGQEQFSQTTSSMSNMAEAYFVAELCRFIVQTTRRLEKAIDERQIGIITTYAKQRRTIEAELQKKGLKHVDVSTVDGFQGQERAVIIMSCVRANDTGSVGFVGNRKRMNVALTRAKFAMYLVGHLEVLESNDEWKPLLADAKARRRIVTVNDQNVMQAIGCCLRQR